LVGVAIFHLPGDLALHLFFLIDFEDVWYTGILDMTR